MIAERLKNVPTSFIREILKVAADKNIISFAGGLPNPKFFPVKEIHDACSKVLEDGADVLQYSTTEGYLHLREYIANRYKEKEGIDVSPDEILITSGSQQGLDLLGKTLINEGENVLMEKPGYLGAIQAFSLYGPNFLSVTLEDDGANIEELKEIVDNNKIKLFYSVPNFHNPSGITYSEEKRKAVAEILKKQGLLFIEDNPYGELRFIGQSVPSMKKYYDNTVVLGSFSKTVAPSFRLGWIYAKKELLEKITIAKQASDLHTNYFSQRVLYQYLMDNDIDKHIEKIIKVYGEQREVMINAIEKHFPKEVKYTKPEGGMFLWVTLPEHISALDLFNESIKENVAFVPGFPFYATDKKENTFRLNYSNVDSENIERGIEKLAKCINKMINDKK